MWRGQCWVCKQNASRRFTVVSTSHASSCQHNVRSCRWITTRFITQYQTIMHQTDISINIARSLTRLKSVFMSQWTDKTDQPRTNIVASKNRNVLFCTKCLCYSRLMCGIFRLCGYIYTWRDVSVPSPDWFPTLPWVSYHKPHGSVLPASEDLQAPVVVSLYFQPPQINTDQPSSSLD